MSNLLVVFPLDGRNYSIYEQNKNITKDLKMPYSEINAVARSDRRGFAEDGPEQPLLFSKMSYAQNMKRRVGIASTISQDLGASAPSRELLEFAGDRKFSTVLADPPWRFQNRTGKVAPEHRRLSRYDTMTLEEICHLPVAKIINETAHLYLWVPNALLPEGLKVLEAWGFQYKSNIVWHKVRKDGGPDGRGVGFYFRNVTEIVLFGVRGKKARTLAPGRRQVNYIATRKREHSRKPDEQYPIIEACSPGPHLELFARGLRDGWTTWGNQADADYRPTWKTYAHHSQVTQPEASD